MQVRYLCPQGDILSTDYPLVSLSEGRWTSWFDQSSPGLFNSDDVELLENLLSDRPFEICKNPMTFQIQTVDEDAAHVTGDVFELFDHRRGLICRGADQPSGKCSDYRVRYFCRENTFPVEHYDMEASSWSEFMNIDKYQMLGDYESPRKIKTKIPWNPS